MKYLTELIVLKEMSPHLDEVEEGWDRLSHTHIWAELNDFKEAAIVSGGLDRYWGPFDKVTPISDTLKMLTICYNNLETAEAWYEINVGPDNIPANENCKHVKLLEINDAGEVQRVVKESVDISDQI